MKNQLRRRYPFPLAVLTAAILLTVAAQSAPAQAGAGKKYGTRDPHTCADRTLPKGNTITAEKAKEYVYCDENIMGEHIYLYDEVTVRQVGKPRPYNPNDDANVDGIDTTVPVTPIRGSKKVFQCGSLSILEDIRGHNCNVSLEPNAYGLCYKDGFGSWYCSMVDVRTSQQLAKDVGPPGGVPPDVKAPPDAQPKAPEKVPPAGNNAKGENDAGPGNGLPKPDLTAMETWFDIVKYEYGDPATDAKLYVWAKRKIPGGAAGFVVEFRDKDGVLIGDRQPVPDYVLNSAAVGEVAKTYAVTPSEDQMKRVATVKMVLR